MSSILRHLLAERQVRRDQIAAAKLRHPAGQGPAK